MFGRHFLAMALMVTGVIVGVILAVNDSWKTGLIVGVIIVGVAWLFAAGNMYKAFKDF